MTHTPLNQKFFIKYLTLFIEKCEKKIKISLDDFGVKEIIVFVM
jgi:hypothetical protein